MTIKRFLIPELKKVSGRFLDVGAGLAPWREFIPTTVKYEAIDLESFGKSVIAYDGKNIPFEEGSFDFLLCSEVLEHVPEPSDFTSELSRVLKPGGLLILTIPFSARRHLLPSDFQRFTKEGLQILLARDFEGIVIQDRGNDLTTIANKLIVLSLGQYLWGIALAPITLLFIGIAHLALCFGNKESMDPLGYSVLARKKI